MLRVRLLPFQSSYTHSEQGALPCGPLSCWVIQVLQDGTHTLNCLGFKCTVYPPRSHTWNTASLSSLFCLYAFAKSWKLSCVKLHKIMLGCPWASWLCEALVAGQKCCCQTHPLTPVYSSSPAILTAPFMSLVNISCLGDAFPGLLCVLYVQPQAPALQLCCLGLCCRAAPGAQAALCAMAASTLMSVLSILMLTKDSIKSP